MVKPATQAGCGFCQLFSNSYNVIPSSYRCVEELVISRFNITVKIKRDEKTYPINEPHCGAGFIQLQ